jgi:hypothetical protein
MNAILTEALICALLVASAAVLVVTPVWFSLRGLD